MTPEPETESPRVRTRVARFVVATPDYLLVLLLAATIAVSLAVVVRFFSPWLVLPLFVVLTVVLWRYVPRLGTRRRFEGWAAAASILFAIGWVAVNAHYASQLLNATRDPSLYTLVGIWLSGHTDPGIDVSGAASAIGGIDGLTTNLGAFGATAGDVVRLQGGATLPALLGIGGWLAGVPGVLAGNTILGGFGLVAVFGLGRRLMPPLFALVAQVALGLSVTMMYLSRATYSETLMLAVCAAGLTWLIAAVREGRTSLWIMAGLFLGSAGFARIDGPVAVIGPAAAIAASVFLVTDERRAAGILRGAPWFVLAALASTVLGIGGLAANQYDYLVALLDQAVLLWAVMILMMLAVIVAVLIRRRNPRAVLPRRAARVLAIVGGSVSIAAYLYWLSRPLWMVARHTTGVYAAAIAELQKMDGVPIDPHRSYDEMTLSWVGWYFGWPTVVLAGIGLALMIYIGVRRRRVGLLIVAGATLSMAALYLTRVSITPDQAWAYRRLLPILTPGLLLAALFPLFLAWRAVRGRVLLRTVAVVGALLVAFVPLVTWNSLLRVVDGRGMSTFVQSMCDSIDGDTVLFATDEAPPYYQVALRTVCDVNVISDTDDTTQEELAQLAARDPGMDVLVFSEGALPGATDLGDPTGTFTIDRWTSSLVHLPNTISSTTVEYWAGTLGSDGTFVR